MRLILGEKIVKTPAGPTSNIENIKDLVRLKEAERLHERENQRMIEELAKHSTDHPNYMNFDAELCFQLNGHRDLQRAIDNGDIYSRKQMGNMGDCPGTGARTGEGDRTPDEWFSDISMVDTTSTYAIASASLAKDTRVSHLILVFIGNTVTGDLLLDALEASPLLAMRPFIGITLHKGLYQHYKARVNAIASAVFISGEYGTDIIPTLQMYYVIRQTFGVAAGTPVIKLHTKSTVPWFTKATGYLLQRQWDQLAEIHLQSGQNTITDPEYMYDLGIDRQFCDQYKSRYHDSIDTSRQFAAGTIFYTDTGILDRVIAFMCEVGNCRAYFTNNIYVCNSVIRNSPIHFIERLFGVIKK